MNEEGKIKSALFRTFIALLFCVGFIIVKFVLKNEEFVEEVYNYLTTDIVFFS